MVWVGTKPFGLTLQYKDRQEQRRHELRKIVLMQALGAHQSPTLPAPQIDVSPPATLPAPRPERRALPPPIEPDLIIFDNEQEAGEYARRLNGGRDASLRGRSANW